MKFTTLLLSILFLLGVSSCSKNNLVELTEEQKNQIVENCIKNSEVPITTAEIKSRVVGKWKLIDFNCGRCLNRDYKPAVTVTYNDDYTGMANIDGKSYNFKWTLEPSNSVYNEPTTLLSTDVTDHGLLIAEHFCQDYLYYNHNPVDGIMVMYQRVN